MGSHTRRRKKKTRSVQSVIEGSSRSGETLDPQLSTSGQSKHTLQLVNEYLVKGDVISLRKIASVRGLVSNSLRKRVWPVLLDVNTTDVYEGTQSKRLPEVDSSGTPPSTSYSTMAGMSHKDDAVVKADMDRSLWKFTKGWSDDERQIERVKLANIINASLQGNATGVYYYQGLHDVASVLLMVCGEGVAHGMLNKLVSCHLRDCTRVTIDPAIRTLRLLYPILKYEDEELYDYLKSLNEPALEIPYFALSWYMTWFAHDVDTLDQGARLFDLFLSSHPLMPLYVAAQIIIGVREELLEFGPDQGDCVYSYLNKLKILGPGRPNVDDIAQRAVHLYKKIPPEALTAGKLKKDLMSSCSVPFASLQNGRWYVPQHDDEHHAGSKGDVKSHALHIGNKLKFVTFPVLVMRRLQTVAIGAIAIGAAGAASILLMDQ